jgi:hypothetical protein
MSGGAKYSMLVNGFGGTNSFKRQGDDVFGGGIFGSHGVFLTENIFARRPAACTEFLVRLTPTF